MLVDTYRYREIDIPVTSIYKDKVLRVASAVIVPSDSDAGAIDEGWMLVRRNGRYAIYTSIEEAIRAYHKAIRAYGTRNRGELRNLAILRAAADNFIDEIMNETELDAEARAANESIIAGLGAVLSGSSDRHKKAACRQLSAAASNIDAFGRYNPGRRAMLIARARNHLIERTKTAARIRDRIIPWLAEMSFYYRERALALRELKQGLEHVFNCVAWDPMNSDWIADSTRQLIDCLVERLIERLKILDVEPFLTCRDLTVSDLSRMRAFLRRRMYIQARESIGHAVTGLRIGLAHIRLENIRVQVDLLRAENRFPYLQPKTVSELVGKQQHRLRNFLANLSRINDSGLAIRTVESSRGRAERAVELLNDPASLDEAVAELSKAGVLL